MSTILKNSILNEINNVEYTSNDNETNSDRALNAIINGLYDYILNEHTFTISNTTGAISTVPSPTPVVQEPVTSTAQFNSKNLLTQIFKLTTRTGIPTNVTQRMFTAISTWINSPPSKVSLTAIGPLLASILPPSPLPHGVILFPTITLRGIAAELEILNTVYDKNSSNSKEKFWEIFSKHLNNALNENIIPPIPTTGLATSGFPYTGLSTLKLSFN